MQGLGGGKEGGWTEGKNKKKGMRKTRELAESGRQMKTFVEQ